MKNLLIATTALVATAGVAAADVSLSGAANVGLINAGGTAETVMYNNVSVTAAMSGETDGGLTFGASLTMRSGADVDLDVGDITIAANALGATSLGNIYVSGGFGKLTFDNAGLDNLMDDAAANVQDVQYEGTFGALAVTLQADLDGSNTAADGDWAAKAVYSANGVTITAVTNSGSEYDLTAAYAINDMLSASVNLDSNGGTAAGADETIVKVAYANEGITAALSIKDGVVGNEWAVALGYAANGLAVNVAVDDGGSEDLSASYDLGGGMSVLAGANEGAAGDRAFFIGSKMSF
ncbi:porin [Ascidiaceihabitans sp.]|nr:porin [Ascidiaceihabitans sp.]